MRLGLVGYGKMGQAIARLAPSYGHTITAILSPSRQNLPITEKDTQDVDLFLDFTQPDAVDENVSRLISFGKSVVIGTTGWYAPQLLNQKEVGLLHSSNFSLGIHLFSQLVKQAAERFLPHYQVALLEEHHSQKLDAPSGTAKELLRHLPKECPVTSLRCGTIVGNHEVIFDSPLDEIRLTHRAKSRDVFAHGAIKAAEWLYKKKGTFTLEEMFHDLS